MIRAVTLVARPSCLTRHLSAGQHIAAVPLPRAVAVAGHPSRECPLRPLVPPIVPLVGIEAAVGVVVAVIVVAAGVPIASVITVAGPGLGSCPIGETVATFGCPMDADAVARVPCAHVRRARETSRGEGVVGGKGAGHAQ